MCSVGTWRDCYVMYWGCNKNVGFFGWDYVTALKQLYDCSWTQSYKSSFFSPLHCSQGLDLTCKVPSDNVFCDFGAIQIKLHWNWISDFLIFTYSPILHLTSPTASVKRAWMRVHWEHVNQLVWWREFHGDPVKRWKLCKELYTFERFKRDFFFFCCNNHWC